MKILYRPKKQTTIQLLKKYNWEMIKLIGVELASWIFIFFSATKPPHHQHHHKAQKKKKTFVQHLSQNKIGYLFCCSTFFFLSFHLFWIERIIIQVKSLFISLHSTTYDFFLILCTNVVICVFIFFSLYFSFSHWKNAQVVLKWSEPVCIAT